MSWQFFCDIKFRKAKFLAFNEKLRGAFFCFYYFIEFFNGFYLLIIFLMVILFIFY